MLNVELVSGKKGLSVGPFLARAQPCWVPHSYCHWEKQFVTFIPFCFMVWWLNRIRPSLDSISVGSDTALQIKIWALAQVMRNWWGVWTHAQKRALVSGALWASTIDPCVHIVTQPEPQISRTAMASLPSPRCCSGSAFPSTHWEEASVFMPQWNGT